MAHISVLLSAIIAIAGIAIIVVAIHAILCQPDNGDPELESFRYPVNL